MNTFKYKNCYIHETFLSEEIRPMSVENGVKIQAPDGKLIKAKSIHAAKCLITRRFN